MIINMHLFKFQIFGHQFEYTKQAVSNLIGNQIFTSSNEYNNISEANNNYNMLIINNKLIINELIAVENRLDKWNGN